MRTLRVIGFMSGRVFARSRPPTAAQIANRARVRRAAQVATDYEEAIARELAARGHAAHLYRTQGASDQAQRAAQDHARAERHREALGNTLFQLRAHRTVSA
jgi:hypothetical protein